MTEHEVHWGDHNDYACQFSGPHCWSCNEPWPCRTSRGLAVEPDGLPLDVERLARALMSERLARVARVNGGWEWWADGPDAFAAAIAAEYAASGMNDEAND